MGGGFASERERGELLMADYLTTDTELTSVADAIRTKGGTSASLAYPAGFVNAINAIPTGGGASWTEHIDGYVTVGEFILDDYVDSDDTSTIWRIKMQYLTIDGLGEITSDGEYTEFLGLGGAYSGYFLGALAYHDSYFFFVYMDSGHISVAQLYSTDFDTLVSGDVVSFQTLG